MPATTPANSRRFFALESGPNRREFRLKTGRAPIVKMSRMMPPTPVAAPWNGSMALGWLWLSILNATAQPPPMSMTPAFSSPALTRTRCPSVGNFFNSGREFLYEQCSLHMTEKMPVSVWLGSRPRICRMRSNSSSVRSAILQDGLEDHFAVHAAEPRIGRPLRVRHEAEDVSPAVANARDVASRAVGVGFRRGPAGCVGVTEKNLAVAIQGTEGLFVREVVAFAVRDGQFKQRAGRAGVGERRVHVLDADGDAPADEMEGGVADERAGEQPRFAENLEAVADAEDELSLARLLDDGAHDGRESRDGPATQVVAIGKAAWQDDKIISRDGGFLVPNVVGVAGLPQDAVAILIAIRSRKPDDRTSHG